VTGYNDALVCPNARDTEKGDTETTTPVRYWPAHVLRMSNRIAGLRERVAPPAP